MAKSKVDKETRKIMEAVNDLIKRKGDRFKFKTKNKKMIKKVKRDCVHWIIRKGKEMPTLEHDPNNGSNWRCKICGASFPIVPMSEADYKSRFDEAKSLVDQLLFYSIKLGGDADDTKMFIQTRRCLKACAKTAKPITKQINKRDQMERNRQNTDDLSQFNTYSGFTYGSGK